MSEIQLTIYYISDVPFKKIKLFDIAHDRYVQFLGNLPSWSARKNTYVTIILAPIITEVIGAT